LRLNALFIGNRRLEVKPPQTLGQTRADFDCHFVIQKKALFLTFCIPHLWHVYLIVRQFNGRYAVFFVVYLESVYKVPKGEK